MTPVSRERTTSRRRTACRGRRLVLSAPRGSRSRRQDPATEAVGARQIVVIGNFDGVHRGHQAVLVDRRGGAPRRARSASALPDVLRRISAVALGRVPPPLLTTLPRKLELVASAAPSITPMVRRFDAAFAAQSPRAFAEDVLVASISAPARLVVGQNFRFGKRRAGDFDELTRLGRELGFATRSHGLSSASRRDGPLSSTRVSATPSRPRPRSTTRPRCSDGRIRSPARVDRGGPPRAGSIGFPTGELSARRRRRLPGNGVWLRCWSHLRRQRGRRARARRRASRTSASDPTVKDDRPSCLGPERRG